MPYCPKCGKEVTEDMNVCPYCGNPLRIGTVYQPTYQQPPYQTQQPSTNYGTKSPGIGALLSFIIPGAGQLYAGRITRGLLFLFLGIPFAVIVAVFFFWLIFPIFLPFAFWVYNIYDAYQLCLEYNRRLVQTGVPPW
jgi:TM2 domain-containing membrane protein YozV